MNKTTMERVEIHVSMNDDASNAGTDSEPLRSLHSAQSAVRQILKDEPDTAVDVIIHSGTYCLEQPLILIRMNTQSSHWRNALALSWTTADSPVDVNLKETQNIWTFSAGHRAVEFDWATGTSEMPR